MVTSPDPICAQDCPSEMKLWCSSLAIRINPERKLKTEDRLLIRVHAVINGAHNCIAHSTNSTLHGSCMSVLICSLACVRETCCVKGEFAGKKKCENHWRSVLLTLPLVYYPHRSLTTFSEYHNVMKLLRYFSRRLVFYIFLVWVFLRI